MWWNARWCCENCHGKIFIYRTKFLQVGKARIIHLFILHLHLTFTPQVDLIYSSNISQRRHAHKNNTQNQHDGPWLLPPKVKGPNTTYEVSVQSNPALFPEDGQTTHPRRSAHSWVFTTAVTRSMVMIAAFDWWLMSNFRSLVSLQFSPTCMYKLQGAAPMTCY